MSKVIISIVAAKSGSGKTTLLEKTIKILKERNIKLAVIKHDAHSFEMYKPGKDTWRHAQAGADIIVISSPEKFAMIEKRKKELTLDEIADRIEGVDLILTEGYKKEDKAKIEVFRSSVNTKLLCEPHELIAIASDIPWELDVPCYHIDDAEGIANEIINFMSHQT